MLLEAQGPAPVPSSPIKLLLIGFWTRFYRRIFYSEINAVVEVLVTVCCESLENRTASY